MQKYHSMVNTVIAKSDILLEVLDARFIQETRHIQFEKKIIAEDRILIYVINKVDLVSKKMQNKMKGMLYPCVMISAKERLSTNRLRSMVKQYALKRRKHLQSNVIRIFIGVIGYPNTGKSTIINMLSGTSSASTSPQSGHTKGYQFINLTKDITLIDSPGVFPQTNDDTHVLVNAIDFTKVKDPEHYVELLVGRFPKMVERHYGVSSMEELALKHRFLKKGGEPDTFRAARVVLKDWQQGRIVVE